MELLSSLPESNGYARANVWHGYQTLRYNFFPWNNKDNPTTLKMEADGSIAWTGIPNALEEARGKISFGASFKFKNKPRIQGPTGAVSMVLPDTFKQRV